MYLYSAVNVHVPWRPGDREPVLAIVFARSHRIGKYLFTSHCQYNRYGTCYMYLRGARIDNYIIAEQHNAIGRFAENMQLQVAIHSSTNAESRCGLRACRPCTQFNKPRVSVNNPLFRATSMAWE